MKKNNFPSRLFSHHTALWAASASPTTYSVSDSIVAFTPAPTPRSRCSLSHAHKFMVFFSQTYRPLTASVNPTTYSVSHSIVSFTPAPTPRSRCSLLPTHSIHTPTLPTTTLLTFTFTQVLCFLASLFRSLRFSV